MEYYHAIYDSPIGALTLESNENAITGLYLPAEHYSKNLNLNCSIAPIRLAFFWLDQYFLGRNPSLFSLPLKPQGTVFQKDIWDRLCRIPYGETVTYGDIAGEIAQKRGIERMSAQAVGQAVGANPISIIIPCHRVVGTNGQLTGYAGGIESKKWLLNHESSFKTTY